MFFGNSVSFNQVYFGPIGYRGAEIIDFLENIDGVAPKPNRMSPGTLRCDQRL